MKLALVNIRKISTWVLQIVEGIKKEKKKRSCTRDDMKY